MSERLQRAVENLQQANGTHDNGAPSLGIGHLTTLLRAQNELLLAIAEKLQGA